MAPATIMKIIQVTAIRTINIQEQRRRKRINRQVADKKKVRTEEKERERKIVS